MAALPAVIEGMIVSTCNRVEIYATSREAEMGKLQLRHFLALSTASPRTNSNPTL